MVTIHSKNETKRNTLENYRKFTNSKSDEQTILLKEAAILYFEKTKIF